MLIDSGLVKEGKMDDVLTALETKQPCAKKKKEFWLEDSGKKKEGH